LRPELEAEKRAREIEREEMQAERRVRQVAEERVRDLEDLLKGCQELKEELDGVV